MEQQRKQSQTELQANAQVARAVWRIGGKQPRADGRAKGGCANQCRAKRDWGVSTHVDRGAKLHFNKERRKRHQSNVDERVWRKGLDNKSNDKMHDHHCMLS